MSKLKFIPTTMARHIGDGVYFRPIRSWHSGTLAGEGRKPKDGEDGSGMLMREDYKGLRVCMPPYTVTHRLYWHESEPSKTISCFLSYPNGMGASDQYFWESYGITEDGDIDRYFGENAEAEMEEAMRQYFAKQ